MPDVELVAIQDFSYATRRIKAGDRFTVTAPMARVLVGIKKAEAPREPGTVVKPPARVVEQAKETTPQPAEEKKPEPKPVPAMTRKVLTPKTTTRKTATRKRPAKK